MKKILLILGVIVLPIVLSGCGERKIECMRIDDTQEERMIATVKGNKIKTISIEESNVYDDLSELDKQYEKANNSNYLYKFLKGVDASVTKNGNSLKSVVTIDFSKAGSTVIREFFDFLEFTPEVFINYAESEGLTCK